MSDDTAILVDVPRPCPHCGIVLDRAVQQTGDADGAPPRDGDVTVCLHCHRALILDAQQWRLATFAEVPRALVDRWTYHGEGDD